MKRVFVILSTLLILALSASALPAATAEKDPKAKTPETKPAAPPKDKAQTPNPRPAPPKPKPQAPKTNPAPPKPKPETKPAPPKPKPETPKTKPAPPKPKPIFKHPISSAIGVPASLTKLFEGAVPDDVKELAAMEDHIKAVSAKVSRSTVGIRIGNAAGSGVIVSPDGLVLTAGHVSREAGIDVRVILPGGRQVKAKTLGANRRVDTGMIQISEAAPADTGWPFSPVGKSGGLKQGQWCLAVGHPGGFRRDRPAPVRLGRILRSTPSAVVTDCTIVSGDSGGPLFDMAGRVIGINSRIGGPLYANLHAPIDAFTHDWDRLKNGEVLGQPRGDRPAGFLGVTPAEGASNAKVGGVVPGSAAADGGIKPGDVIVQFDGKEVKTFTGLAEIARQKKAGDKVKVVVLRSKRRVEIDIVMGTAPGPERKPAPPKDKPKEPEKSKGQPQAPAKPAQ